MKNYIKHQLFQLGIFNSLDLVRQLPKVAHWIRTGCTGNAPQPLKCMILSAYLKRYELTKFIETGTYHGNTLAYMAQQKNVHATSIELNETYYRVAEQRFSDYANVTTLYGDSGTLMPELISQLRVPALFWLDGHYSGGETAKTNLETPISAELEAILQSTVKGHVILIDDARCFDGTHDYPHLDRLLETVRVSNTYEIEVSVDIIRLTPTKLER